LNNGLLDFLLGLEALGEGFIIKVFPSLSGLFSQHFYLLLFLPARVRLKINENNTHTTRYSDKLSTAANETRGKETW